MNQERVYMWFDNHWNEVPVEFEYDIDTKIITLDGIQSDWVIKEGQTSLYIFDFEPRTAQMAPYGLVFAGVREIHKTELKRIFRASKVIKKAATE